jgi:hypothetical protein
LFESPRNVPTWAAIKALGLAMMLLIAPSVFAQEGTDVSRLSAGQLVDRARAAYGRRGLSGEENRARWEQVHRFAEAFQVQYPGRPEDAELGLFRGTASFRLGERERAVTELTDLITRHPKDDRVLIARFLRGLAHAGCLQSIEARRDFETVARNKSAPDALRDRALYAWAEVAIQLGEVSQAKAALVQVVESVGEDHPMGRKAKADLADLVRVGGPAPQFEALTAHDAKPVVICVLRRPGDPVGEAILAEARAAVADAEEGLVLDCPVDGFDAEAVQAFGAPALPRAYVVGARNKARVVLAAGLRGAAFERVLSEACPKARSDSE